MAPLEAAESEVMQVSGAVKRPRAGTVERKLARVVAKRIERDILSRGWPVGEILGSEPELLARYGVSRAVLREAVRLVEHMQIARMRRGPGGGLVITEPQVSAVTDAAIVYLQYERVQLEELFEARQVIEAIAIDILSETLGEDEIAQLRTIAQKLDEESSSYPLDFHLEIVALARNPALSLFVRICTTLTTLFLEAALRGRKRTGTELADSAQAHHGMLEALLEGNGGLARHRNERHLSALSDYLSQRASGEPRHSLLPSGEAVEGTKRAELVARSIFSDIVADGWPVGSIWGSEASLIEQQGISRAVFREAIRILEHHQVALMRRGPGGGLLITAPSVDRSADAIALYLDHQAITPQQLHDARLGLELAAIRLASQRLDPQGRASLEAVAEHEQARREASQDPDDTTRRRIQQQLMDSEDAETLLTGAHQLHRTISALSKNRVIDLFLTVLLRLSVQHTDTRRIGDELSTHLADQTYGAHATIIEALINSDADIATHRMKRHLGALAPWQH